jgi:hypothetical protein
MQKDENKADNCADMRDEHAGIGSMQQQGKRSRTNYKSPSREDAVLDVRD